MKLLLVILALVISYAASENIIYFNATITGCEGPIGCNWNDPAIWVGGIVPSNETDIVHLNDTRPNIHITYNSSQIYINTLYVSGVMLAIQTASLNCDILVVDNATLSLDQHSFIHSYEDTVVQHNSSIFVYGTLSTEGSLEFSLDDSSSLYAGPGSKLQLYDVVTIYGVLELDISSSLEGGSFIFGLSPSFLNTPTLRAITFKQHINGSFYGGILVDTIILESGSYVSIYATLGVVRYVDIQEGSTLYLRSISSPDAEVLSFVQAFGTLVISSSNLTVGNSFNTVITNIIFAGKVNVLLTAIILESFGFDVGERGEEPYIYIDIHRDPVFFELRGLHVPGEIEVDNSFLSLTGSASFSGGIQSLAGSIHINGAFTFGGPIVMVSEPEFAPIISLQGDTVLTAPLLHIQLITELASNDRSSIIGNVRNDGVVVLNDIDVLTIFGNYTQGKQAQLALMEIDPLINETGFINVTGTASLDGYVVYQLENTTEDEEMRFPILFASGGITGKFQEELLNEGSGNISVKLEYNETVIYFVYGGHHHHDDKEEKFWGLEWWAWALIAAAGVLVFVILLPFTYYRLRVRGRYEPIELGQ